MNYDYIKRSYKVEPRPGVRVQHLETKRYGLITKCDPSATHHVQVRFDGQKHSTPCHPLALDYNVNASS